MARYNIALASLLASKAIAAEVSINPNGAIDRSLFSKVNLHIHHIHFVFPSMNLLANNFVASPSYSNLRSQA